MNPSVFSAIGQRVKVVGKSAINAVQISAGELRGSYPPRSPPVVLVAMYLGPRPDLHIVPDVLSDLTFTVRGRGQ